MAKNPFRLNNLDALGRRLKEARKQAGLTQADVAQYLGTTQQSITRWETGKAELPLGAIKRLAQLYAVSVDFLLADEKDTASETKVKTFLAGQGPEYLADSFRREAGEPPHGYDLIRLPRGDPHRLSPLEADMLEKALTVLRAKGEGEHFAQSLMASISSFYKGMLLTNSQQAKPVKKGQKVG